MQAINSAYSFSNKVVIEYAKTNIIVLSASVSKNPPKFDTRLYFLATAPSRQSQLYLTNKDTPNNKK
jgi:hypothetical protein